MGYFSNLDSFIKSYFEILAGGEIPLFLEEYINTREMQRISNVSMGCGTDYTKLFNHRFFYSNLDHSVGVALIIWNFTHSKKQTLAGLFHDIATPVFKHCIDFMNGDYEKQESTEELTTNIIKNSKEIMELLQKDGIELKEIDDYKIYPIADNDTPQLSADRFEYNFSNGFAYENKWNNLDDIKRVYNNIIILKNEHGIEELGFKDKEIAEEYISIISKIWPRWISKEVKITMQFLADCVKILYDAGLVSKNDLYTLSEKEIIEKIKECNIKNVNKKFEKFTNEKFVYESDEIVEGKYYINIKAKRRYIIPLVEEKSDVKRINQISEIAKNDIENYWKFETQKYIWVDIDAF